MKLTRDTRESLIGPLVISPVVGCFAVLATLAQLTELESSSTSKLATSVIAFISTSAATFLVFGLLPTTVRWLLSLRSRK